MEERRRFKRFDVAIPCTVQWSGRTLEGLITRLSMGGALISRINGVPPPGTPGLVTLNLAEVQETVEIELDTKVVHSLSEVQEGTGLISAGVQFSGSAEETRKKLLPIFRLLGLQED